MATPTTAVKEIFEALPHIKKVGAKHLWFEEAKMLVGITITNVSKKFKA